MQSVLTQNLHNNFHNLFFYQKLGILFHSNVNHNTNDSLEFRYVENVSNQKFTEVTKITNELLIAKLNYHS